jgi:hypothetical protein
MKMNLAGIGVIAAAGMMLSPMASAVESITDAFKQGEAHLSFRLRDETVEQKDIDMEAKAYTLRTRLNFKTADYYGFRAFLEFDDVSALDDNAYKTDLNTYTTRSVIQDPEYTEINQSWLSYTRWDTTATYGNQRIVLDNQRFIGNVGFRQNEQTYDAFSVKTTAIPLTTLYLAKVYNVNRILGEGMDHKHDTVLLNASVKAASFLTVTPYYYQIENIDLQAASNDTVGVRLSGNAAAGDVKFGYAAEFASQSEGSDKAPVEYDADYSLLEGSVGFKDLVTVQLGYELLGSDDGIKGFQTPLATLHAHNGWADQFLATPAQGLVDVNLSVSGKVVGIKWAVIFRDYSADEKNAAGDDDLGDELDLLVERSFGAYGIGLKYASYSAGDATFGKTDTEKLWLTATADF